MYRELIDRLVPADEAELYPGAKTPALDHAGRMLRRNQQSLPADYHAFLAESDGLSWNGIRIFGIGAAGASKGLLAENRDVWRDAPGLKGRMIVGRSESFHLTYDPATRNYGRFYREGMTADPVFRADSFADLLTASITERMQLGLERRGTPARMPGYGEVH